MDQERPLLVEVWLGGTVLVEYVGGQLPETGAGGDMMAEAQPRVKTARFVLENYNRFGIEVRPTEDSEPQFLAWGAVLRIAGTDQETPEEDQREREQVEQMEESGTPRDRQELIDRLANARNLAEVADARAAADSWLAANPGDVRLAREQLQEAYPEEDLKLEEGSPT
ncbi:MAG: hypothetical protein M3118_05035 [Actinomycetota bacterium]|nr:hypothetical protein [Actinomycetota bacterium]